MSNFQHIFIEDDGRLLAEAVVQSHPDPARPDLVEAMLRVEAGPIPSGATSRLVDAVLDLIQVPAGTALEMTFPTGEAEMLEQIRSRCFNITTRVAGVSCRLRTTVPIPSPPADRYALLLRSGELLPDVYLMRPTGKSQVSDSAGQTRQAPFSARHLRWVFAIRQGALTCRASIYSPTAARPARPAPPAPRTLNGLLIPLHRAPRS
jgi:hypothetical protein